MADKLKVGIVGLGAMGLGMAVCLTKAGFEVSGFDINPQPVARLVHEGGKATSTPRDAATNADILVIVVATSDQASTVVFDSNTGALAALGYNSVLLLCITATPEYVIDFKLRLEQAGRSDVRLIDCPISGGEVRAWQGTLSLLCAGKQNDIDHSRSVLDCLSSQLHIIPGCTGAASSVKMIHQILVGVHILATVEVMGLAYVAGLDLRSTYDNVMKGDGASWLFSQRAAHILDENSVPASSLMIITKDFAMLTASARINKFPLHLASVAYQIFVQTSSAGWSTTDDCHTINTYLLGRGQLQDLRHNPKPPVVQPKIDESGISKLLIGIHAVAAIEVLRYAKRLEIDVSVLQNVVKDAAGSSVIFDKVCGLVGEKGEISMKCIKEFEAMREDLASGIDTATCFSYPLMLASTALQQFYEV